MSMRMIVNGVGLPITAMIYAFPILLSNALLARYHQAFGKVPEFLDNGAELFFVLKVPSNQWLGKPVQLSLKYPPCGQYDG